MPKALLEILKFVYALVLAVVVLLVMAMVLDLIALAVTSGWKDFTGHSRTGSWPIVRGMTQGIWLAPGIHILALWVGVAAIVRAFMGRETPFFLRRWTPQPAKGEGE